LYVISPVVVLALTDRAADDAGNAAGVARAVVLVEQEIPDVPTFGPVIQGRDDALGEAQSRCPSAADASFGIKEIAWLGRRPWTMRTLSKWSPVYQWKAAPQIYLEASFVVVRGLDALINEAPIVVPDHEFSRRKRPAFSSVGPRKFLTKSRSSVAVKMLDSQTCVARASFWTVSPTWDALGGIGLDVLT